MVTLCNQHVVNETDVMSVYWNRNFFVLFCESVVITILFGSQGANISQLERDIGADQFPPNEHYFGLVNVSLLSITIIPS